jgi:hypothetical protein
MEFLLSACAVTVVAFGALYAVAQFVKVCLDIYNNWPRKPPTPS